MKFLKVLLALSPALLAGCPVTQPENTPVPHRYEIDPVTKSGYYIYVPSNYRADRAWPVIVSCHGSPPFDVAEYHVREWKMLCERNGCIVVAPILMGTDGVLGDGPLVGMYADERMILSVLSWLGYRYNIDRANIMITGFSGGGFPAYWVGLRHPEIFSTIVARSCNFSRGNTDGWYPPDARKIPVMVYYGENDPLAIVLQSRDAIAYLQSRGFAVESRVLPGSGHDRHPEVAMEFFIRHKRPADPSVRAAGR